MQMHGDDRLGDVAGFNAIFRIEDDANILEAWKPIAIGKEEPEYRDFIGALDECIEAIRGSNEFSAEFPVERENVLAALEEGRAEVEKDTPNLNKSKLHRYFIDPLRWVGAALGKSALTAVANATIQKLIALVSTVL